MRFIDFIKKRKDVIEVEGEGLNSAIHCIHRFEGRAFTFKGLTEKYKGLDVDRLLERLQDELNSMAVCIGTAPILNVTQTETDNPRCV